MLYPIANTKFNETGPEVRCAMKGWQAIRFGAYAAGLFAVVCSVGAAEEDVYDHHSPQLHVSLAPRTPEQMAAFYEARGFGEEMIEVLRAQCYITVLIENKSEDIVWLDLAQWRFSNADGEVQRPHRDRWKERWQAMDIPLAHQSTFRWTLLPEQLDFPPGEREGGNIVLPRLGKPLKITASFDTGERRTGRPIEVVFDEVHCAENPE